jgi:hypothetical protein
MKRNFSLLLLVVGCCLLFAPQARADDYAYGYTSIYVDGNVVRGYHRTEVDYNTEVYYTPYVCGSLYKDDVEVVRGCGGGIASATRNTQTPYYAGSSYSALSDHSVNIEYQEEDPSNPGYYYYPDYLGYFFSGSGSHPIDWYYFASQIYNQRPNEAIYLGNTTGELCSKPTGETVASSEWADSEGGPTFHKFTQVLLPFTISFSGRTVSERDPGGTADGCWQTGDPAEHHFTGVTGGIWSVASDNTWGPDYEGYPQDAISYFRNNNRVPCSVTVPQRMVIYCGLISTVSYKTNSLGLAITATTISSIRNDHTETRTWP